MQFEHVFAVAAPPDAVWAYLTDPYRVAPALPGASITEKVDERTYAGGITVKVGPVTAKYRGTVRFESLDPAARTASGESRPRPRQGEADSSATCAVSCGSPGSAFARPASSAPRAPSGRRTSSTPTTSTRCPRGHGSPASGARVWCTTHTSSIPSSRRPRRR